jgi:hypothetical protein
MWQYMCDQLKREQSKPSECVGARLRATLSTLEDVLPEWGWCWVHSCCYCRRRRWKTAPSSWLRVDVCVMCHVVHMVWVLVDSYDVTPSAASYQSIAHLRRAKGDVALILHKPLQQSTQGCTEVGMPAMALARQCIQCMIAPACLVG